jgi:hypothetical protein
MDNQTKKIVLFLIEKVIDKCFKLETKTLLKVESIGGFAIGTIATIVLLCLPDDTKR